MIIVRIIGGLGNQMFQYALGLYLANKHNAELKLDVADFYKYPDREFLLNVFNINAEIASDEEITNTKSSIYFKERGYGFDEKILNLPDNIYLDGYWQSEKYFLPIADLIKKDFTFRKNPVSTNLQIIDKISNSNSVCIHIRRGDYVSNLKTYFHHAHCSLKYYQKGIDFIIKNVKNPHFFIFSDEPDWAKQNLKINAQSTIIDNNPPEKGYEDLRLMMNCKHFIIANSSFSWWGAWLGNYENKIVIAPKKWFGLASLKSNKNPVPKNWIKL